LSFRCTYPADLDLDLSSTEDGDPTAGACLSIRVDRGPEKVLTAAAGMGFVGTHALRYDGDAVTAAPAGTEARVRLHEIDEPVAPDTQLSYVVFPVMDELAWAAGWVALDVLFGDGTRASGLGALDQLGYPLTAAGQGRSKALYHDQWNYRRIALGAVAAGRRAVAIELVWSVRDASEGPPRNITGYVDDVRLYDDADVDAPRRPSNWVITTRGTNATRWFSRGNNIPATAVPNGFAFYTPLTDARSTRWLYAYADGNDDQNRPRLQGLAVSHEPSPWMGDRLTFQVMPQAGGEATADALARSLPFDHEAETARPHHYAVHTDAGIVAEIAPTDHAAIFRFTFTDDAATGPRRVVFDNVTNDGGLSVGTDGVVTGFSDVLAGPRSEGAGRMFVYGTLDAPVVRAGSLADGGGVDVAGFAEFADDTTEVSFRFATSFIGHEQARANLELELDDLGFDDVVALAQLAWDERLSVIAIDGELADAEARTTVYSNLYRLNLYPNSAHENVGTADEPVWRHASPVIDQVRDHTPTATGNELVDGKIYVNNGFWDTYRTAWPLYVLLYPTFAGELVDGFVQHYREAGWIPVWSSPGFADCMVGTSSDVAFADALAKGVTNFDIAAAYESALRNACVATTDTRVGRKSAERAVFLGYTPVEEPEGFSWSIDGYINDFGIATMAGILAGVAEGADREQLRTEQTYFGERAKGYVRLFDDRIGFFQGRLADGSWRCAPADFDPADWGSDYTETNAWNMAFTVPHDGAGLAGIYGGRDGLAAKLDEFFSTPETGLRNGTYPATMHEILEARAVRMGMFGHSNQPAHHIPFAFLHALKPHRTQEIVREVMRRFHSGSQIGQGYGGDEDNGEMSAWHIFAALGIYPASVGSDVYVLGSPLYGTVTVRREDGSHLVVKAAGQAHDAVYVGGVTLDGVPHERTWLSAGELAATGELGFSMSGSPAPWGTGEDAVPPSLSDAVGVPDPLTDVAGPTSTALTGLVDDSSATGATVPADGVVFDLTEPARVELYTLTSAPEGSAPDAWRLEISDDGSSWSTVDERAGEFFAWARFTRPFAIAAPVAARHYRLTPLGGGTALAQVELLARGAAVVPPA
jgi:predicted alpha-1,2-mannosidase